MRSHSLWIGAFAAASILGSALESQARRPLAQALEGTVAQIESDQALRIESPGGRVERFALRDRAPAGANGTTSPELRVGERVRVWHRTPFFGDKVVVKVERLARP